jgi:glycosyltransferase involved in cell wall biosynthesis
VLRVALITLGDPGRLTGGYLFHRRIADAASRHDARLTFYSVPDRSFPLAVIDGPRVMRAAVAAHDVVVLDSIAAAFVGPALAIHPPGRPLVGMLHQPPGGIDHGPRRATLQAALDQLAYRRARRLLAASEALAVELTQRWGIAPTRVQVVPPGRDVAPHHPDTVRLDLRQGRQVALLCVANWVERKGVHSLLDAVAGLPSNSATLHLVGDDHVDAKYSQRLRTRLGMSDLLGRVVVHGPLPLDRVADLYASADVFVLTSVKEPYGTVYGEAMASGLPVVGWRAGNLPYLAEDGKEGLVVAPGDEAALRAALARLIADEPLRQCMGAAARVRALSRPTWADTAALFYGSLRHEVER